MDEDEKGLPLVRRAYRQVLPRSDRTEMRVRRRGEIKFNVKRIVPNGTMESPVKMPVTGYCREGRRGGFADLASHQQLLVPETGQLTQHQESAGVSTIYCGPS